ncbi:low temperature requirement protein A [Micromonospora sp. NBC_01796]|uniref:low temperature requirement protein A n=1 Tax=Micromonospora sp. NBC_01796 TaxID=2975987 RepID=UPI002DDC791B|nr:low temperature requirement protein A [Micromonospora sp. NBC_01796]WSA87538.1 low temperature requirement protein A [Micromonospora sp. NBC_01796]
MSASSARGRLGDHTSTPRVTVLELLFDVVFVFALTRVAQRVTDDLTIARRMLFSEAGQTLLLLLALWMVWYLNAWMTSRFDPQRADIQLVVVVTMFGSLLIAVCLPQAFGDRGLIFACAYVTIQVGRPLYLVWALRGHDRQATSIRVLVWALAAGVLWLSGGISGGEGRAAFWIVAVLLELVGPALRWPTPRLGRPREPEWTLAEDHLAERYVQFLLIALGESVIATGIEISVRPFETERMIVFVASFLTTVLFWRIFFYHAGLALAQALHRAPSAIQLSQSASYTLLVMVAGILVAGVGFRLIIDDPEPPVDPAWVVAIMGGPALFLAGRVRFEHQLFGRVRPSMWVGLIVMVAAAPGMVFLPPLAAPLGATLVLAGLVAYETLTGRREPASNPPL